jgi:hypothetical protein
MMASSAQHAERLTRNNAVLTIGRYHEKGKCVKFSLLGVLL